MSTTASHFVKTRKLFSVAVYLLDLNYNNMTYSLAVNDMV